MKVTVEHDPSARVQDPSMHVRTRPRQHPLRWVSFVVIALITVVVIYSIMTNPRFEWGDVGHYFTDARIVDGLITTLWLTGLCMAIGTVLGTFLAMARLSKNPLMAGLAVAYIWVFRGTPVLVQLFLWYNIAALYPRIALHLPFGGPTLFDVDSNTAITPTTAAILGLSLHVTAYMGEIIRGGIISVDEGQSEAARSLGMTPLRTMFRIVLPQAIRTIIPGAANELISLLKYTSLVSVLAVSDLLYSAQLVYNINFKVIPLLLVASIWYLLTTTVLTIGQHFLERRFARGRVRTAPARLSERFRSGVSA